MGMFVQVVRWNWGKSGSRRGCHVTDACDDRGGVSLPHKNRQQLCGCQMEEGRCGSGGQ